MLFRVKLIYR